MLKYVKQANGLYSQQHLTDDKCCFTVKYSHICIVHCTVIRLDI